MLLFLAPILRGGTVVINFEDLTDGTFVTTQYSGLTFSNSVVLSSGISLNELDFPPYSGNNVVSDTGGPISIIFSTPVTSFSGFFTYVIPVNIAGYSSTSSLLASTSSLFTNNTVSGGDTGSTPNELLKITSSLGFSRIVLTGDLGGGSFTLDDLTYVDTIASPEPLSLLSTISGFAVIFVAVKIRKRSHA